MDPKKQSTNPVPVVPVLSPVGVEYVFMAVAQVAAAVGLVSALMAVVNGKFEFSVLAFPAALLLVAVPVFAALFLRLKQLEVAKPDLRLDPSRRRTTQVLQIGSFLVVFGTLISWVAALFHTVAGSNSMSLGKMTLNALCVLVVAGGILVYYWFDEHRVR